MYSGIKEREFSNPKYNRQIGKVASGIPDGAIRHPDSNYSYNAVWTNPSTGEVIDNFNFIEGKYYKKDLSRTKQAFTYDSVNMGPYVKIRDAIVKTDLKENGNVFSDNDNFKVKGIPYVIDTQTHWLSSLSSDDSLVYSKDITSEHRLTYSVDKPVLKNGQYVCDVTLNNCLNHRFNDKDYVFDTGKFIRGYSDHEENSAD